MERDCLNCINHEKGDRCRTMKSRPKKLFCWADKDMLIKQENDIIAYAGKLRSKLNSTYSRNEYANLSATISQARAIIRRANEGEG